MTRPNLKKKGDKEETQVMKRSKNHQPTGTLPYTLDVQWLVLPSPKELTLSRLLDFNTV